MPMPIVRIHCAQCKLKLWRHFLYNYIPYKGYISGISQLISVVRLFFKSSQPLILATMSWLEPKKIQGFPKAIYCSICALSKLVARIHHRPPQCHDRVRHTECTWSVRTRRYGWHQLHWESARANFAQQLAVARLSSGWSPEIPGRPCVFCSVF